jgi:prevent-host-death family protein
VKDSELTRASVESISVTQARRDIFKLLEEVVSNNCDPVIITSKHGSGVLIALDEWNGIIETIRIMSNKKLQKQIEKGMQEPLEECIEYPFERVEDPTH